MAFSRYPTKVTKSEVAASPLPSRGPKGGRKSYVTPAFSGVPKQGGKIRSGRLDPTFSWAQNGAEVLRNRTLLGIPKQGNKIRSGCLTPAFSRGQRGRKCYATHVFSGIPNKGTKSQRGRNCYVTPCALRGPQTMGENPKWLPHHYLLGSAKDAGSATQPLRSWGPPNKGTKPQKAASPLPS